MINVYITGDNKKEIESKLLTSKADFFITFYDEKTRQGKSLAYKLKTSWSAYASPFAIVYDNDKPLKAFYSETDSDIINSLIVYLNENCCSK